MTHVLGPITGDGDYYRADCSCGRHVGQHVPSHVIDRDMFGTDLIAFHFTMHVKRSDSKDPK